jgi:Mono-functional DNA-alkylating methyl methanesulfonate N-term
VFNVEEFLIVSFVSASRALFYNAQSGERTECTYDVGIDTEAPTIAAFMAPDLQGYYCQVTDMSVLLLRRAPSELATGNLI